MVISAEVELRKKNQMTLPEKVAGRLNVRAGSRLLVIYDEETGEARIRPLRASYAGTLRGVYGRTPEEIAAYLEEERRNWGDA